MVSPSEVEVGTRTGVGAVEQEGAAVVAGRGPGGTGLSVPVLSLPEASAAVGPAVSSKAQAATSPVGGGRPPASSRSRRRVAAQVAGGVGGAHAVAVRGRGRQAGVRKRSGRPAWRSRRSRAAAAEAALEAIAGDADVVGRGRPGQVDLGALSSRSRSARPGAGRCRVRRPVWSPWRRRVAAQVARGVGGAHPVAVARGRASPGSLKRSAGRGRDLR